MKIKLVTRNAEKSFLSQSSFYFSDWMSRRVVARVQLSSCSNAKLKEHANYFPHSTENHSNTTVQLSYQENDHNLLTNGRPFVGERRMLWSRVVVHIPLKFECVKCSKLLSKKYMDNISLMKFWTPAISKDETIYIALPHQIKQKETEPPFHKNMVVI